MNIDNGSSNNLEYADYLSEPTKNWGCSGYDTKLHLMVPDTFNAITPRSTLNRIDSTY